MFAFLIDFALLSLSYLFSTLIIATLIPNLRILTNALSFLHILNNDTISHSHSCDPGKASLTFESPGKPLKAASL